MSSGRDLLLFRWRHPAFANEDRVQRAHVGYSRAGPNLIPLYITPLARRPSGAAERAHPRERRRRWLSRGRQVT